MLIRRAALTLLAAFGLVVLSCAPKVATPTIQEPEPGLTLSASTYAVETGSRLPLSAFVFIPEEGVPALEWTASKGTIEPSPVANEVDFLAPDSPGMVDVSVVASLGSTRFEDSIQLEVLPPGALKTSALVTIEVDASTLRGVWVDGAHPSENLTPPLKIKGTFRYDSETQEAFAGGSWPVFEMRDDGQKGDRVAGDEIWTIAMNFEKGDAKVYFAFDDNSSFRVEWESGLAWRLKSAWIDLDEFPDDTSNPAFIPDGDKVIRWTADMAKAAGIHGPRK